MPDLPTMSEYYPGFEATSWHGLFAPAGTPAPIVEILNRNVNEVLARPEIARLYAQSFIYPFPMTSEAYGKFVRDEIGKWTAVVKASGTQIE
jgi:tripartite-type tricarboxylate transporter receptor subunit TctC